jgi:hypothetical protein
VDQVKNVGFLAALCVAISPAAATAQEYGDVMNAIATGAAQKIDVSQPGDDQLSCDQIRAEVAQRDQQIAGMMGGTLNGMADRQMAANEAERKARVAAEAARDVANMMAPAGLAPGNAIEAAANKAIEAGRAVHEGKMVADATSLAGNVQFVSQRIPYLHRLYGEKCGGGQ